MYIPDVHLVGTRWWWCEGKLLEKVFQALIYSFDVLVNL